MLSILSVSHRADSHKQGKAAHSFLRIQVMSYNIGGFTTETYAAFANRLQTQNHADIAVVQETHWELGKEDSCFETGSWTVATTSDSANRWSGVAVFMRIDSAAKIMLDTAL